MTNIQIPLLVKMNSIFIHIEVINMANIEEWHSNRYGLTEQMLCFLL